MASIAKPISGTPVVAEPVGTPVGTPVDIGAVLGTTAPSTGLKFLQENPILKVIAVIEHGLEELLTGHRVAIKNTEVATLADAHSPTEIVGIATHVDQTM